MKIRNATRADVAAIGEIWNGYIRDTSVTFNSVEKSEQMLAQDIAQKQREGHAVFVAEQDGRISGFALYGWFRSGPGYADTVEHTVMLDRDEAGNGLGRALMQALEEHARAAGKHVMIAAVSGENEVAISFHLAVGYNEVGRLPDVGQKFQRRMDLILLQKIL